MTTEETLAPAIVGHLVGDYLLQNDYVSSNKKQNPAVCALHCMIWTICVMTFAGWTELRAGRFIVVWTILYVTHFIQDHTNIVNHWMDLIGQNQFRTGPCAPWAAIVVDNVWHILTIWIVWRFVA